MRSIFIASMSCALLAIAIGSNADTGAQTTDPTLTVIRADTKQAFTVAQLKEMLAAQTVSFVHPYYEKQKSFEGFALGALLKKLFPSATANARGWQVQFQALDGYQSEAPLATLFEAGGYLIFRDAERPEWEKMKKRQVSPGPFAVVWTQANQLWADGYPWPWQIKSIRLVQGQ